MTWLVSTEYLYLYLVPGTKYYRTSTTGTISTILLLLLLPEFPMILFVRVMTISMSDEKLQSFGSPFSNKL
jgi:hypothetical protein